jgi:hypothetical protein
VLLCFSHLTIQCFLCLCLFSSCGTLTYLLIACENVSRFHSYVILVHQTVVLIAVCLFKCTHFLPKKIFSAALNILDVHEWHSLHLSVINISHIPPHDLILIISKSQFQKLSHLSHFSYNSLHNSCCLTHLKFHSNKLTKVGPKYLLGLSSQLHFIMLHTSIVFLLCRLLQINFKSVLSNSFSYFLAHLINLIFLSCHL